MKVRTTKHRSADDALDCCLIPHAVTRIRDGEKTYECDTCGTEHGFLP